MIFSMIALILGFLTFFEKASDSVAALKPEKAIPKMIFFRLPMMPAFLLYSDLTLSGLPALTGRYAAT